MAHPHHNIYVRCPWAETVNVNLRVGRTRRQIRETWGRGPLVNLQIDVFAHGGEAPAVGANDFSVQIPQPDVQQHIAQNDDNQLDDQVQPVRRALRRRLISPFTAAAEKKLREDREQNQAKVWEAQKVERKGRASKRNPVEQQQQNQNQPPEPEPEPEPDVNMENQNQPPEPEPDVNMENQNQPPEPEPDVNMENQNQPPEPEPNVNMENQNQPPEPEPGVNMENQNQPPEPEPEPDVNPEPNRVQKTARSSRTNIKRRDARAMKTNRVPAATTKPAATPTERPPRNQEQGAARNQMNVDDATDDYGYDAYELGGEDSDEENGLNPLIYFRKQIQDFWLAPLSKTVFEGLFGLSDEQVAAVIEKEPVRELNLSSTVPEIHLFRSGDKHDLFSWGPCVEVRTKK